MKEDIKSLTFEEVADLVEKAGEPGFRAEQIFTWLHKFGVKSFDEMTNVPKKLKSELEKEYYISGCEIQKKLKSKKDETVKYLLKLADGEFVEAAVMEYSYGKTICVSTQVGCKMGCRFCASTIAGFKRNLTAGEIESEVHCASEDLGIRISNVVLMGIGEGLDNYKNVIRFLKNINSERGLGISMRSITLSTCGVVPGIYKLMEENMQLTLAISLHAPNDEIRNELMPVNERWGVEEVLGACRDYSKATGRRVTFEYTLIDGVNDSGECARELAARLKGMLCNVNLIPLNDVKERDYKKSNNKNINKFMEILKENSIGVTIRRTLGSDINASCGQLRRAEME